MKGLILASLTFLFIIKAFPQNNPPVAVNDTVEVMAQVPVIIDALANDYDPDGDGFNIDWFSESTFYSLDTIDRKFMFKSGNSLDETNFRYKIKDNGSPPEISESARVSVNILVNPDVPLAVSDTFEVLELVPVELDVLVNDLDSNGDALKISGLDNEYKCEVRISDDSMHVIVIPDPYYNGNARFSYFVKESDTPEAYLSDWVQVHLDVLHNPDIPVAMPDSSFTTGGIPVSIPVLENDYDPQGEDIEIKRFTQPGNGIVTRSGDDLIYTPEVSFTGSGYFQYKIRESGDTNIYSGYTPVHVAVAKNPDCPVGVPDQAEGMTWSPITIDVLANDYDINGDPLELLEVETNGTVEISDNKIVFTSNLLTYNYDTLYYRARQSNDTTYYSEWTPVYVDLIPNPVLPVAVEDHYTARAVFPIIISPLMNDLEITADSLEIVFVKTYGKSAVYRISDSLYSYQAFTNVDSSDSLEYIISDKYNLELRAKGKIYIDITDNNYYDSLVINNINAGVSADGMLFADVGQLPGEGLTGDFNPHFKYPNGSGTNTIFNSLMWIGGISVDDSLFFAGGRWRAGGSDVQPGPVSDVYDSNFAYKYWKLWKLNKSDVEYHRNNWSQQGYHPIEDISTWPGNGVEDAGQAAQLALYFDFNQDAKYEPMNGDYPLIRGDQCIYFIMNDDKMHDESFGNKLKVEIHGMVYGFDTPDDSVLNNTVFVHYELINRSNKIFNDTYIGIFTDFDLGNFSDDNVGSDVSRGSYYCFNGDLIDENLNDPPYYFAEGFGEFPPAQSMTVLAGPLMDVDGTDNPAGGCDFSVNGLNFGNNISDDERLGLTGFMFRSYSGAQHTYDASELYKMMKGLWADDSRFQFGGNGHYTDPGAVGPDCNFMFPGDSDPLNFGTGCVQPNPPYNIDGFYWTDSITFFPGDRNGLGSMGPFTFKPGDVQEIELAYVVANGWNGPVSSVNKLMEYIDTLRYRVSQGEIIVPNDHLGIVEDPGTLNQLKIFPNPAGDQINIKVEGIVNHGCDFVIIDLLGKMVFKGKLISASNTIDISALKSGFYMILIKSEDSIYSGKFIKQ